MRSPCVAARNPAQGLPHAAAGLTFAVGFGYESQYCVQAFEGSWLFVVQCALITLGCACSFISRFG